MTRFAGKVALITGGAGSIGWAAAQRFAEEGARIILADREMERATDLARQLPAAQAVGGDLGTRDGAEAAVAAALQSYGRLDILFNNAGISGPVAPLHELDVADWDEVVRSNLRSVFLVLQSAARAMIAAKRPGTVVNMGSSMGGWDVLAGSPGYLATKHAVVGLTKSAALDLARYGIRVNAICPGVIETPLGVPSEDLQSYHDTVGQFADRIPLRRIGQPADVAATVAFLASDDARHITGAAWLIDGGQTLQSWANAPEATAFPFDLDRDDSGPHPRQVPPPTDQGKNDP